MPSKPRDSTTTAESEPRGDEPVYWMACEECGAWVSSELIGPDGAGESADGGFCCTSCRFREED